MNVEDLIPPVAQALGIDPATALLIFGVLVAGANLVARIIPDDKTGPLGIIRKISKVIGLYASNKVTSGVTVNQVARTALPQLEHIEERLDHAMEIMPPAITVEEIAEALKPSKAFPNFQPPERDPLTGKFKKKESPNA